MLDLSALVPPLFSGEGRARVNTGRRMKGRRESCLTQVAPAKSAVEHGALTHL